MSIFNEFKLSDITLSEEALELLRPLNEEESQEVVDNFSAAVKAVTKSIITEQVIPHFESEAQRVVEEENQATTDKISDYLEYVVKEFVDENKESIEESLKLKSNEELIESLKNVLTQHGLTLNEETDNVVEKLNERVAELESRLEESQDEVIELRNLEKGRACEKIFNELCEGLTVSQKEKFLLIVEDFETSDVSAFEEKAQKVRDTFFSKKKEVVEESDEDDNGEVIVEDETEKDSHVAPQKNQTPNFVSLAARFSGAN